MSDSEEEAAERVAEENAMKILEEGLPKGSSVRHAVRNAANVTREGLWSYKAKGAAVTLAVAIIFGGVKLASGGDDKPSDAAGSEVADASLPGLDDDEPLPASEDAPTDTSPDSESESESDCADGEACDPQGDTNGGSPDDANEGAADARAADAQSATDVIGKSYNKGSHIFTMTVAGDGEAVSAAATTTSYSVGFRANYEPDTYAMDFVASIRWDRGGPVQMKTSNGDWQPFDSTIDVVWLDSHTLQVTVSDMPFEVDVERMWMNIQVVIEDDDGRIYADFSDESFLDPA